MSSTRPALLAIAGCMFLLSCASLTRAGSTPFEAPYLVTQTPGYTASFVLGDFNGDGKLDMVVSTGGALGFLAGRGDGTFEPFRSFALGGLEYGPYWESVAKGDVNEDGVDDIVALDADSTADVYIGDGSGAFRLSVQIPHSMGGWASSIVAADVNQDSHLDLLMVTRTSQLYIAPGRGDGTFEAGHYLQVGPHAQNLTVADLNRDGIPDLIVAYMAERYFSVFFGTGGGQFSQMLALPAGFGPAGIAVGDLNHDGNPDIAVANGGWECGGVPTTITEDSTVTVYEGDGQGHFAPAPSVLTGILPWSVSFADMDGDGVLDLVVGHAPWGGGICWASTSTNPFSGRSIPPRTRAGTSPGATELSSSPGLSIFRGKGDGTFEPNPIYRSTSIGNTTDAVDLNRDDRPDVVAVEGNQGNMAVLLANQDGSLGGGLTLPTGTPLRHLIVADLNHDGVGDVVGASPEPGTVLVFPGRSDRHLESPISSAAGDHPVYISMGDLDNDGDVDLAVANLGVIDSSFMTPVRNGSVMVLRGDGHGSFSRIFNHVPGGNICGVRIGDLNGDGHADLIAGVAVPPSILIYLGHGDGTFSTPLRRDLHGFILEALALGDFNDDGHMDVAVSVSGTYNTPEVYEGLFVLFGRGDGSVSDPVKLSRSFAGVLEAPDLDLDGRADLVSTGGYGTFLDTYLSNGDGTFTLGAQLETGQFANVAVLDLTDGIPDLATTYVYPKNGASVFTGVGAGMFTGRIDYPTGNGPSAIAAGDLDGDGSPDLAIANFAEWTINGTVIGLIYKPGARRDSRAAPPAV